MMAINVDEDNLISYIMNSCQHIQDNVGLAFKLAQRHSLGGADELFTA
jgi:clathrin heavy chain